MAFPSIGAYTADEKAKVKADIDEVSSVISAIIVKIQSKDGILTHREQELLKLKAVIDVRSTELV